MGVVLVYLHVRVPVYLPSPAFVAMVPSAVPSPVLVDVVAVFARMVPLAVLTVMLSAVVLVVPAVVLVVPAVVLVVVVEAMVDTEAVACVEQPVIWILT